MVHCHFFVPVFGNQSESSNRGDWAFPKVTPASWVLGSESDA
jgi:hypothetical protein